MFQFRYGLTLFALTGNAVVFNLSTDSLYGGPAELKSVILSSKNIGGTLGYGPEDGYPAIHQALSEFQFREGVERRLVLFADEVVYYNYICMCYSGNWL